MKHRFALPVALCLAAALAVPALAEKSVSIEIPAYQGKQIESADVQPVGSLGIDINATYEGQEIQGGDVQPIEGLDFGMSISPYESQEIQAGEIVPIADLDVGVHPYEAKPEEDAEVDPSQDIHAAFPEYDLPDLEEGASEELRSFYVDLVRTMDDDQRSLMALFSGQEVTRVVQTQYDLVGDLSVALANAGLNASIDPVSGMIPVDAKLLYATDQYQVTDTGKAILSSLFRAYCAVLSQDKYRNFVGQVRIIGHTDTDGSYEYNVTLSRNRAEAVKAFCLSDACGVEDVAWLSSKLTAEGRSYDELIYNEDGTENKAASRRVEIAFKIAL